MDLLRILRINGTTLRLWDTYKTRGNKSVLRYEFKQGRKVLFSGEDFYASPCHAIDSLATAYSCLSFLALKPEDTDSECFENYTEEQIQWAKSYACEYLSCCVSEWQEKNGCN